MKKLLIKLMKTFINESKSVKIHEKSRILRNFTETRKWAFFTEEGQFHGKCHGREIVNYRLVPIVILRMTLIESS